MRLSLPYCILKKSNCSNINFVKLADFFIVIQPGLQRKLRRLNIILVDTAHKNKSIQGHKNYQKFVILCRSRTGSNFLVNLLQSHPQIRASGEIFTGQKRIDWGYPIAVSEEFLRLRETNPVEFVDRAIFREVPKSVLAVGFKLFYSQAKQGKQQSVWTHLQNQKDLKIIHLTRKNLLKAHLSRTLAVQTKTWVNTKNRNVDPKVLSISLDYQDCLHAFKETQKMEEQCRVFFSKHSMLEVSYEELVQNVQEEIGRIQDFLTVKNKPLYASIKKQSKQPISTKIANYSELKEKSSNTPWKDYF